MAVSKAFDLSGQVIVITGGAGLLGRSHARAIAEMGGAPVLCDIDGQALEKAAAEVGDKTGVVPATLVTDITRPEAVERARDEMLARHGRIDGLINNAANNPKMVDGGAAPSRLETLPLPVWDADIAVGLTGAFLCARTFGAVMARDGGGVILNIASDLALIGPDQRLYRKQGVEADEQPVKPVTYSVVKAGLLGLTRYLATYWADKGVRCNAICPGGVFADQESGFVQRLEALIPMQRMAHPDEYQAAIVFLMSDASSYMNGAVVSIDGGRTAW